MMNTNNSNVTELSPEQVSLVSGGDAQSGGYTFGTFVGNAYWGAREYLADTVYPYWLD